MPRLRVLLLVALVGLTACSSSNPSDVEELDGGYTVAALRFDPVTQALPDADIRARLNAASTRLEIFGGDGIAQLTYRFSDEAGRRRADLNVTATNGRITFEALTSEDEEDLRSLFLPRSFSLSYTGAFPTSLTGDLFRERVDLQAYDPELYQDQTEVRGNLTVVFAPAVDDER
jgi:major membrane immunogen (membrane-anchored lipoprotein)